VLLTEVFGLRAHVRRQRLPGRAGLAFCRLGRPHELFDARCPRSYVIPGQHLRDGTIHLTAYSAICRDLAATISFGPSAIRLRMRRTNCAEFASIPATRATALPNRLHGLGQLPRHRNIVCCQHDATE